MDFIKSERRVKGREPRQKKADADPCKKITQLLHGYVIRFKVTIHM